MQRWTLGQFFLLFSIGFYFSFYVFFTFLYVTERRDEFHGGMRQACTESDTGVSKSFLPLLFESNRSFFFFFTLVFVYFPLMCCNPSESDSLETASPLQVPLMAYGD